MCNILFLFSLWSLYKVEFVRKVTYMESNFSLVQIAPPTFYGTRFFFLTKFVKSMPPLNKMLYKLLLNPIHPQDI